MSVQLEQTTLFTDKVRAEQLRSLAERWDDALMAGDAIFAAGRPNSTQAERNAVSDIIVGQLVSMAAEYADVLLPMEDVLAWMLDLRNAVHALARFETGDGWDGDDDPGRFGCHREDTILAILNQDIDDALYPLLRGGPTTRTCFECRRTNGYVWTWRERVAGSLNCEQCQS